tara:strand:+ start:5063 stop:5383 length:321 start_codon:yes stop_codon:yes gene_type:complete
MSCEKCDDKGIVREGVATITCENCDCPDVDEINPAHYKKGSVETFDYIIDVVRDLPADEAYMVGNIIKYVSRYREKHPDPRTDIEKARWHLNRLRNLLIAKDAASE